MTNDKMDLHALVGKTADGDFLCDRMGFAAQRLMELEVGDLTGAGAVSLMRTRLHQMHFRREGEGLARD